MSLTQALGWWRARALRERLLLIGGSLGLLLAGTDALLTAPLEKRLKRTRAEVQALDEKLQRLLPGTDPTTDPRTLEATLRERLEQARLRNAQLRRQLADAARLPETLRAITATVGSARLLELDLSGDAEPTRTTSSSAATAATASTAATAAMAAARVSGTATAGASGPAVTAGAAIDAEAGPGAPRLYRLPITLKVAGSYGELQMLLTQIERHAQALQWSQLTLDNSEWPAIQLTLRAHVLSTGPRWGSLVMRHGLDSIHAVHAITASDAAEPPRHTPQPGRRIVPPMMLVALAAAALPLRADPMRPLTPPPTAVAAAPMASWQATRPVVPASAGASAASTIQADRLVAIRRDSDGRWRALLGERWVGVGAKAGTATVRAIDHNSVTLVEGRTQLVLNLLPPLVASRDADAASAAASAATTRRRSRTAAVPAAASAPAPTAAPAAAPATPLPTRSAAAPSSPPSVQAGSPALTAALTVVLPAPTSPRATP